MDLLTCNVIYGFFGILWSNCNCTKKVLWPFPIDNQYFMCAHFPHMFNIKCIWFICQSSAYEYEPGVQNCCDKWLIVTLPVNINYMNMLALIEENTKSEYQLTIYRIPRIVLINFIGVDIPIWFSLWNKQKSNVHIHQPHNHFRRYWISVRFLVCVCVCDMCRVPNFTKMQTNFLLNTKGQRIQLLYFNAIRLLLFCVYSRFVCFDLAKKWFVSTKLPFDAEWKLKLNCEILLCNMLCRCTHKLCITRNWQKWTQIHDAGYFSTWKS